MTCPARCDQFLSNYIQILVISSNEFHAQKTEVKTAETNAMCGFKGIWWLIIQSIICTTIYTLICTWLGCWMLYESQKNRTNVHCNIWVMSLTMEVFMLISFYSGRRTCLRKYAGFSLGWANGCNGTHSFWEKIIYTPRFCWKQGFAPIDLNFKLQKRNLALLNWNS